MKLKQDVIFFLKECWWLRHLIIAAGCVIYLVLYGIYYAAQAPEREEKARLRRIEFMENHKICGGMAQAEVLKAWGQPQRTWKDMSDFHEYWEYPNTTLEFWNDGSYQLKLK